MDLSHFQPRPKPIRYLSGYLALLLGVTAARLKIRGRRHIPSRGPYLIAMNHFSIMDPALVLYAIQKPINFLMASDQVVESLFIWAPWLYGFIPTDRQRLAPSTIKASLEVLRRGDLLGIFPEGHTQGTVLRPAKKGALFLAMSAAVPILPLGIEGADTIWENWNRGQRPLVTIRIGKSYHLPEFSGNRRDREAWLHHYSDDLMLRIASLLPEKYHGCFTGRPEIKVYQSENRLVVPSVER